MPTIKNFLDYNGLTELISSIGSAISSIWTALNGKQNTLTFDNNPTQNSSNPVKSGGVYTALSNKLNTLVSGTNIKTLNNESLLGSGNITANEIDSITVVETAASGGRNVVTITDTDGNETTFGVTNGRDGVSVGEVGIVDDLDTGGHTDVLSSEMGKVLGNAVFSTKKYTESDLTKGKLWLNHSVDTVADTMNTNANFGCIDIPVVAGDIITVHSKSSSWHNTTWAITDTSRNILSNADRVDNAISITLSIERNGYVFINCASDYYENFAVYKKYSKTTDIVDEAVSSSHYASKYKNNPLPLWKDTLKVLAIGNSYTEDPTSYIRELISGANIDTSKLCIYIVTQSSSSIQTWVENYEDSTVTKTMTRMAGALTMGTETQNQTSGNYEISGTVKELLAKDWDVVVVLQVSTLAGDISTFDPYLSKMIGCIRKECTNPKVAIAYQSVWSYKSGRVVSGINYGDNETRWEEICHTTRQMAAKYGIDIIIPTGTAILNARNTSLNTDGEMTRDGTHLALGVGRYVAACTWFQTLIAPMFGIGIVGNPAVHALTSSEANAEFDYEAVAVDSTNKRLCQLCAFYATVDRWKITTVTAETIDDYDPTYPATIYDRVATLESGQATLTEQTRKVTAEDLAGTSDWIRAELTALGWQFGKYINTSGGLSNNAGCCVSPYLPISMSEHKGHSIIFKYMYYIYSSWCVCFYDSNKTYISGLYYQGTATNTRTVTLGTGDTWDNVAYARFTFNSSKLLECSVYDDTTKEYIWRGDEYIEPIYDELLISSGTFRNLYVTQEEGTSKTKVMSQDALSGIGFASRFTNNVVPCKGITTTNQTYRTIGLKLNNKQKQLLEDADTITIRISSKKFWENNNYAGVQGAFWFVYNSAGGFAGMTSCGINNALTTLSNVRYYPDHLTFVIDMVNGVVKTYWEKTLLTTFTNDGYKKENVLGESGILKIFSGNTQIPFVLYQFDVYDGDITPVFGITQMKDYLSFDSLSPIIKGNYTQTTHHGQMAPSTYGTATGYTIVQASASPDGYKHITSSSSTTWYPGGYYINHAEVGRLIKYCVHIEVVSGAVQIGLRSTACNSTTPTVVNETTGETVTASNVGVGTYKVIGWGYGVDTWCLKYVSGDPMEVIIKNTDYHLISCVISLDCRNVYNGQLFDKEVGIFYPKANMLTETLSSGRVFVNPTPSFEDFNPIVTSTSGRPGHTGQFAIASDKAYISVNKDTWKQITNS